MSLHRRSMINHVPTFNAPILLLYFLLSCHRGDDGANGGTNGSGDDRCAGMVLMAGTRVTRRESLGDRHTVIHHIRALILGTAVGDDSAVVGIHQLTGEHHPLGSGGIIYVR